MKVYCIQNGWALKINVKYKRTDALSRYFFFSSGMKKALKTSSVENMSLGSTDDTKPGLLVLGLYEEDYLQNFEMCVLVITLILRLVGRLGSRQPV